MIEPFSPKCNIIVGCNGAGKSNFFAAIRFVLSDAYTQMGRQERQALLHEGSGSAVMSAFVEIIFDNTDDRFPTGRDQVVLRRTIGLKKDEYTLDRKSASKTDVMNLLESAGFSRSNPYYIVPQGRVTTLTNMKDSERLLLLKEVAGTQVYEQRRSESLRIMDDTDNKRAKIDELLKYIEERLGELEEEKEELRGYQEKDRERRCLEYTIYHREQVEIGNALDSIEEGRQRGVEGNESAQARFVKREKEIQALDSALHAKKQDQEMLKVDKSQLDDERRDLVRHRAQIELDLKALTEDQEHLRAAKLRYERELAELTTAIAERDDWLRNEIRDCHATLTKRKANKAGLEREIADAQAAIAKLEANIQDTRNTLDGRTEKLDSVADQVAAKRDARNALMDERKELWRQDAKLDSAVEVARQELEKADRALSATMDNNTARGLKAVRRIKQQLGLTGCYGTLAELMEVEDKYRTAVEVTAGQSLFHYIVDNDETATTVLTQLNKERSGRLTFMPLNRLNPRVTNFPELKDGLPMIRKVKFESTYRKAFEQVFGKSIICPDLNVASQYARSHGVSAITLGGDRADKKGALTGGYHDPRRSRLEAVKAVRHWQETYERTRQESLAVKRQLERKDQEITHAVGELQIAEAQRAQAENSYGPLRAELQSMAVSLGQLRDGLDRKLKSNENVDASLKSLQEQLDAYQTEIDSSFKKTLTPEEEASLEALAQRCQELRKEVAVVSAERADKESRKSVLEVELRENLRMRLDQLKGQGVGTMGVAGMMGVMGMDMDGFEMVGGGASGGGGGGGSSSRRGGGRRRRGDLGEVENELARVERALAEAEDRLADVDEGILSARRELDGLEKKKAELQAAQQEEARTIERQKKRLEKSMAKRAILHEKATECSRNIRDLGVLPDEAFGKFERVESNKVVKQLHRVNEALKKFSHVNKKAFEQYNNFTKQRDTLQKRREELDKSQASIEELIQVLDQRKDEAIERTFRQVSKDFAEIFEKLVPAGRGRLVIQRKVDSKNHHHHHHHTDGDGDESDSDDEEEQRRKGGVENYTGVGISVSFNSRDDEQQRIQQLSGGQKSLCMPSFSRMMI